ncbi:MAG: 5-carboxymethyl-2-hydroxymuconate Delta-isomerase [Bacteroidota bacterium]
MPHFIIECSESIIKLQEPEKIIQLVYDLADATGLFAVGDIKVRINPYQYFTVGNKKDDFIHVFGNIMEGRTSEQKKHLSEKIVGGLKGAFPDVPIISMNVRDFEKSSYCNRAMIG